MSTHATLYVGKGSGLAPGFDRIMVSASLQELSPQDRGRFAGPEKLAILNGRIERIKKQGGDFIVLPNGHHPSGNTWRTLAVLEQGGNAWCKVVVTPASDASLPTVA